MDLFARKTRDLLFVPSGIVYLCNFKFLRKRMTLFEYLNNNLGIILKKVVFSRIITFFLDFKMRSAKTVVAVLDKKKK